MPVEPSMLICRLPVISICGALPTSMRGARGVFSLANSFTSIINMTVGE